MSLFGRGQGKPKAAAASGHPVVTALLLEGEELVAAVGESFYQEALLSICGARRGDPVEHDCTAVLVAEPDNVHDPNAIMVQVDGRLVAHLSRQDAVTYQAAVQAAAASRCVIACPARIAGRGHESDTLNLGIFLHLPDPDQALAKVRRG